jgi:two-component system, NarL family, invasion response regulator UvrY
MMRILIADDHPIVRQGIGQLLVKEFPDAVIDEADSGLQATQMLRARDYAIVLLDLSLPDKSGLDCLEDFKRLRSATPVLVLSMYEESQFASRVMKAGASGYLHKQRAAAEILKAVRKVLAGGQYLSEAYAEQRALAAMRGEEGPAHERLTPHEFRIMRLIASGKTVGEIAEILSRSVKTVSSHRVRILEKMNMKTNAELTHYSIKNQLVD